MSLRNLTPIIVCFGTLLTAPAVVAQVASGQEPPYRLDREVTIHGIVESSGGSESSVGKIILVTLKHQDRFLNVLVAPQDWLEKQNFKFENGAQIEVTGDTITKIWDYPGIRARRITHAGKTLVLRDESGKPKWH